MSELLKVVEVTDSTNDDVAELGRRGAPHGAAVAAHRQRRGRGRRGHTWVSPAGGLYLSVLLRPQVSPTYWSVLPLVAGTFVLQELGCLSAQNLALKWPNDLVIVPEGADPQKLAGILVERKQDTHGQDYAVVGIGINLTHPDHEIIRPELVHDGQAHPLSTGYLEDCLAHSADVSDLEVFDQLAERVRSAIVTGCDRWVHALTVDAGVDPLEPLRNIYEEHLYLIHRKVRVYTPDNKVAETGQFLGVDGWGKARIQRGDGTYLALLPEQGSLRSSV